MSDELETRNNWYLDLEKKIKHDVIGWTSVITMYAILITKYTKFKSTHNMCIGGKKITKYPKPEFPINPVVLVLCYCHVQSYHTK